MVSIRWLCLSPLLLITLLSLPVCQCFTVLAIFPHMGMSHWLFFRPFVTELVRRGHNVTLLSYFGIDEVELRGQQNYHEYLFKRDAILTNTFDLQVCDLLFNCLLNTGLLLYYFHLSAALHSVVLQGTLHEPRSPVQLGPRGVRSNDQQREDQQDPRK